MKMLAHKEKLLITLLIVSVVLCSFAIVLSYSLAKSTSTLPVRTQTGIEPRPVPTPASSTPNPTATNTISDNNQVQPSATPDMTPTPRITTTPQIHFITVTDEELKQALPQLPNAMVHFLPENKVAIGYKGTWLWQVTVGVDEGKLYFEGIPRMINLSAFDPNAGSYLERREVPGKWITREWLIGIPPWLDFNKYNPGITELPPIVSIQTGEGSATIGYLR